LAFIAFISAHFGKWRIRGNNWQNGEKLRNKEMENPLRQREIGFRAGKAVDLGVNGE
jgi:hypothetical protein